MARWHAFPMISYKAQILREKMAAFGALLVLLTLMIGQLALDPTINQTIHENAMIGWSWIAYTIISWVYGAFLIVCAFKGKAPWPTTNMAAIPVVARRR